MKRFALRLLAAFLVLATLACLTATPSLASETTLSVQTVDDNGLDISLTAANTDGSKFINPTDQRTFVVCSNTNGSTRTVTAEAQVSSVTIPGFGAVAISDQDSVVPITSGLTVIGPFPSSMFNDSSGYAHITYSATAGLSCGVAYLAAPAN